MLLVKTNTVFESFLIVLIIFIKNSVAEGGISTAEQVKYELGEDWRHVLRTLSNVNDRAFLRSCYICLSGS